MHLLATETVFETLADPVRRGIVELLLDGEQAVNDLVGRLDIHQSGVSRHLRILSEAGFVQMRPDGARRLYSLRPEPFQEIDAWVARYRRLWEGRLDRFGAELERRQKSPKQEVLVSETTTSREASGARSRSSGRSRRPIEDVWALWTTKDGVESWWGPEGFGVTVHAHRPAAGRRDALRDEGQRRPTQIEAMKRAGMPLVTEAKLTYREILPHRRLAYFHAVDFVPGVAAYDVETVVELSRRPRGRADGGDHRRHARRALDRDGGQGLGEPARQGACACWPRASADSATPDETDERRTRRAP